MVDKWCELKMWEEWGVQTEVEILDTATGALIVLVPYLHYHLHDPLPNHITFQRCFVAATALLGIGTALFHAFPHTRYKEPYFSLLDWEPMLLFSALFMYARLEEFTGHDYALAVPTAFVIALTVMFFECHIQDPVDINNLLFTLVPAFVYLGTFRSGEAIIAIFTGNTAHDSRDLQPDIILCAAFSIVAWVTGHFMCDRVPLLALFHAAWHLSITWAMYRAALVALRPLAEILK